MNGLFKKVEDKQIDIIFVLLIAVIFAVCYLFYQQSKIFVILAETSSVISDREINSNQTHVNVPVSKNTK